MQMTENVESFVIPLYSSPVYIAIREDGSSFILQQHWDEVEDDNSNEFLKKKQELEKQRTSL